MEIKEQLKSSPEEFVKEVIKEFTRTSPANRLSFLDNYVMWDKPLVRFADGDDPLFNEFKSIIAPTHFTPREALALTYSKNIEDLPSHLSVISWILPTREETRVSNRKENITPSRLWSHSRWYGEIFNKELRKHVVTSLTKDGYLATAPFIESYFKTSNNDKGPYSNWSERHIAYVAGHGTFSLSDGFITERGIAHRCGSAVTDLLLKASPRITEGPYSNCLFYVKGSCKVCITRCPAEAITEEGHDKIKCQQYLHDIGYNQEALKDGYKNDTSVAGCGLCQVAVPCEFINPTRNTKKAD
ncbi:hypothetical protein ACFLXP_04930 [Chloroflexota bacterium]